ESLLRVVEELHFESEVGELQDLAYASGDFATALRCLNENTPAAFEDARLRFVEDIVSLGRLWVKRVERDIATRQRRQALTEGPDRHPSLPRDLHLLWNASASVGKDGPR